MSSRQESNSNSQQNANSGNNNNPLQQARSGEYSNPSSPLVPNHQNLFMRRSSNNNNNTNDESFNNNNNNYNQQQQRNASSSFVEISQQEVARISAQSGFHQHLPVEERERLITTSVSEAEQLRFQYDEMMEDTWYPQVPLDDRYEQSTSDSEWLLRNFQHRQQQQSRQTDLLSSAVSNNNNVETNQTNDNNRRNDTNENMNQSATIKLTQQQQLHAEASTLLYATGGYGSASLFSDNNNTNNPNNNNNSALFLSSSLAGRAVGRGSALQLFPKKRFESQAGASITLRASLRHPANPVSNYAINFDGWANLYLTIAKRTFYVHLPTTITVLLGSLLVYTFLLLSMGDSVAPGGELFDPFIAVFFSGIVGGTLSVFLHLPPLVGILWAAIFFGNIGDRALVSGITAKITTPIKMLSLTMILLMGGLSVNVHLLKPIKWTVLLLATIPLAFDIIANFFVTRSLFYNTDTDVAENENAWALLHAAVLAPASASVVVSGVIAIQSYGRGGAAGGPLIVLLTAVPLESALGIFVATFQQRLVLENASPTSISYLAPLQIIGGALFGAITGFLLHVVTDALDENRFLGGSVDTFTVCSTAEREKFGRKTNRRIFALILAVAGTGMLVAKHFEFEGAGSLFVVTLGATLAYFWNNGDPRTIARKKHVAVLASSFWNLFSLPCLYTFVGVSVHLDQVFSASFFWKGFCCFLASFGARVFASALVTFSPGLDDLSRREKIVMCLSMTGKASSQAALALFVVDKTTQKLKTLTPQTAEFDTWTRYAEHGQTIANSSIIMILFAAPICATLMRVLGRRWVRQDVQQ